MYFEIGKYYKHTSGLKIAILGIVTSTMYGRALVAERSDMPDFMPVAYNLEDATEGWEEITEDEWLECFS